jgi:hypothetical protein
VQGGRLVECGQEPGRFGTQSAQHGIDPPAVGRRRARQRVRSGQRTLLVHQVTPTAGEDHLVQAGDRAV